jgi:hypothetical protein
LKDLNFQNLTNKDLVAEGIEVEVPKEGTSPRIGSRRLIVDFLGILVGKSSHMQVKMAGGKRIDLRSQVSERYEKVSNDFKRAY